MSRAKVSEEELAALRRWAAVFGKRWKQALREAWEKAQYRGMSAEDSATLQRLRNASSFGPAGLERFRLADHDSPILPG